LATQPQLVASLAEPREPALRCAQPRGQPEGGCFCRWINDRIAAHSATPLPRCARRLLDIELAIELVVAERVDRVAERIPEWGGVLSTLWIRDRSAARNVVVSHRPTDAFGSGVLVYGSLAPAE
jgi:hypothetical protein